MQNQEIANQIKKYLQNEYALMRELDISGTKGGQMRQKSGDITETLIEMIWNNLAENYPNLNAYIYTGTDKPYRIEDYDGNYIEESVDKHCYINNELVLAIECKSYLDKCYMQRADGDFNLLKSYNKNFDGIIVSIENGIADNSYNFFLNRKNIDKVYYLATGKRNSAKDKKICYHEERISDQLIMQLIEGIEQYFKKYNNN